MTKEGGGVGTCLQGGAWACLGSPSQVWAAVAAAAWGVAMEILSVGKANPCITWWAPPSPR